MPVGLYLKSLFLSGRNAHIHTLHTVKKYSVIVQCDNPFLDHISVTLLIRCFNVALFVNLSKMLSFWLFFFLFFSLLFVLYSYVSVTSHPGVVHVRCCRKELCQKEKVRSGEGFKEDSEQSWKEWETSLVSLYQQQDLGL